MNLLQFLSPQLCSWGPHRWKKERGLQQKTLAGRQFGGRRRGLGLYQIFGVIARKLSLFSFYWGLDLYEIMRAGREAGPHRPLVTLDTRASNEPSRRLMFYDHSTFIKEKALVGAFSVIIKLQSSRRIVCSSTGHGAE